MRKKADPAEDTGWYYCLKHHTVEAAGQCPAKNRLGPYATQQEASHALEKVDERNEEWKKQDQ